MRSPGNRVLAERALRAFAFAALAWIAWALMTSAPVRGRAEVPGANLARELPRWTRQPPAETLEVALACTPPPLTRAWLAALAHAGTAVRWTGAPAALAVEALPLADPAGGLLVLVAAPAGTSVRLSDSLGTLDSAAVARTGAAFTLPPHGGPLRAAGGGEVAQPATPEPPLIRHVVVLGSAGWESRFVVQVLEERGWMVDARLAVAPGVWVAQGAPFPLDTARHAAVVVLDSLGAGDAAQVAAFVRGGGGALVTAAAARSLGQVAAGAVGAHVRAPVLSFALGSPRRALALDPVQPRGDAVVLERQGAHVAVAARRVGAGRVVQVGYAETWRWRMGGGDGAPEAHREWWASLVAAVAYRPTSGRVGEWESGRVGGWESGRVGEWESGRVDPAPLVSLVDAIGPASPPGAGAAGGGDPRRFLVAAAALLFAVLLAEWTSRRLRGAA